MEIHKHKFIIIGGDESNMLGQIRCLGEKGIKPIAVITEKNPFLITKSKYLGELHQVNSIAEIPQYVAEHWGNEQVMPFLYTDRDILMCMIDDYYDLLDGKFYFWNAGGKGRIRQLLNKEKQMALAKESGLNVIPTERVKRGELPKTLGYPIFTKAADSLNPWWKANAFICYNEKELLDAYQRMGVDDVLLQKYIEKKDEMPIEGISIDGGREVKLLLKKSSIRFAPRSFGTYSQIMAFNDEDLEGKVKNLMQKTKFTGVFEIEFIVDKQDVMHFLEINFRTTQFNHAYADFGINIPYLFAISQLKGHIVLPEIKNANKEYFVMNEPEDMKYSVIHGNTSFWQWLKDFRKADSYLYIDKHDMGPFWALLWSKIRRIFKREK